MPGTAVEWLPGGIVDRLMSTVDAGPLAAVRAACVAGAFADALRQIEQISSAGPATAAWRGLAWHGCWLMLLDGTARPEAIGDRAPVRPSPLPPDETVDTEQRIIGRLLLMLAGLRDKSSGGQAQSPGHGVSPMDGWIRAGLGTDFGGLDSATQAVHDLRAVMNDRPDLLGHLNLLAGDMAARVGDLELAEQCLRCAWHRLGAAGDTRGQAAVSLVAGDWRAAPLTSPQSWNCVLDAKLVLADGSLADSVEMAEFDGTPVDVAFANVAYDEAARLYTVVNDRVGLATVALRRAYLAVLSGKPGEGVELAEQARAIFQETGRPLDLAIATVHGALAAIADDRSPADVRAADAVVVIAQGAVGYAPALSLGLLCVRMGRHWAGKAQPERARAALTLAERIWSGMSEPELRANTLADIAEAAASIGDIAAATVAVLDALAVDPAPLAEPAEPKDFRRIRRAMFATRMYHLARKVSDAHAMDGARQIIHETLDPLRARMDGFSDLDRTLAMSLLKFTELAGRGVLELVDRAHAAVADGDLDRAAAFAAEARAVLEAVPVQERGLDETVLRAYEGDLAGASDAHERYLDRELSVGLDVAGQRLAHAEGLTVQLSLENTIRARVHYDALASTAEPWWTGLGASWTYLVLEGELREQENDLEHAAVAMDNALRGIEEVRATLRRDDSKRSFFAGGDVQDAYLGATRIMLRLRAKARSDYDAAAVLRYGVVAFDYAERGRARALLDLMTANVDAERVGLPTGLIVQWREASAEVALAEQRLASAGQSAVTDAHLSGLRRRLRQALDDLSILEAELQRTVPRIWAVVNPQAAVSTLDAVASVLPAATTLIQYGIGRQDLLAWPITSDGMGWEYQLDGMHRIQALVHAVVEGCAHGATYDEPARLLADMLIEPMRSKIEASTSLFIVPAGPLMRLPFAVLPWNGATLGEALPITILPSASSLCAPQVNDRAGGRPLVVGDPADMAFAESRDQPATPLPPLPGARLEAASVARLLPGALLLTGADATEERVKSLLSQASVIHFATHGLLDAESPLGSAILLALGESLTVSEFVGARLNADLVVMSACHTGEGDVAGGDELLGLSRVLFAAGAHSAVVTLWAVDDLSAALLMVEFHRRRLAGESDAQALRSASRYLRTLDHDGARTAYEALRAEAPELVVGRDRTARTMGEWSAISAPYSHPYHWAPFVLISTG